MIKQKPQKEPGAWISAKNINVILNDKNIVMTVSCLRVSIVTLCEISVVRSNDGVLLPLFVRTVPLSDTRPARVGKHGSASLLKGGGEAIPGNRGAYLAQEPSKYVCLEEIKY